ncbi:two-component sensor histidine kinase [Nocardioides albidus]|uniref:histidine kinase n=1 Tax=Nocardioides albidus TaxID=1517589 RepID=A0A5C4W172_9ACTN|nr:histidine kinase [Nocardioides albidus]TNM41235.1 two-component sensor histidine kinase [Nocardioides albidus]
MPTDRAPRLGVIAAGIALVAGLVGALLGDVIAGVEGPTAVQSFQLTNLMIGVPAGVCGLILAWHRPDVLLGRPLIVAGLAAVATASSVPLLVAGIDHGWPLPVLRTISTAYMTWTACQFLGLPLAVLIFPDGRVPGRSWRWVPGFIAVTFAVEFVRFSGDTPLDNVPAYASTPAPAWTSIGPVDELLLVAIAASLLEVVVYVLLFVLIRGRYRRGDETVRRQLLWLLWALAVAALLIVLDVLLVEPGATAVILVLGLIGLVPVAMTFAVLRHEVLDIRLVWSRSIAWLLLTSGVLAAYLVSVAVGDVVLSGVVPPSVPAAVVVAVLFHPARMWLQRTVEVRMYGERADPVRAASAFTAELATRVATPGDLLEPLRVTLRLPYAELRSPGQPTATSGQPMSITESFVLRHAGAEVGELLVGVRRGQGRLDPADRAVLALIAGPLALALHAGALTEVVQQAADDIQRARSAERHRLRNDLHDGLGPLLTGIAFHADAVSNLAATGSVEVPDLIDEIRRSASQAIVEVRTLIERLRPVSVEELGLVGAIERHTTGLAQRSDGSRLQVVIESDELPVLPAPVESALFRIAVEAVTNVARHSSAERVDVEIGVDGDHVVVAVSDDGGSSQAWSPGVGLRSMRERATEVGGSFVAGPGRVGGEVRACLPWGGKP